MAHCLWHIRPYILPVVHVTRTDGRRERHSLHSPRLILSSSQVFVYDHVAILLTIPVRPLHLIIINQHKQGKVHNPTGAGVRAVSSGVQKKTASVAAAGKIQNGNDSSNGNKQPHIDSHSHGSRPGPHRHHHHITDDELATQVKEGTAKRNITRKKTDPAVGGNYDSKSKKMGGAG